MINAAATQFKLATIALAKVETLGFRAYWITETETGFRIDAKQAETGKEQSFLFDHFGERDYARETKRDLKV